MAVRLLGPLPQFLLNGFVFTWGKVMTYTKKIDGFGWSHDHSILRKSPGPSMPGTQSDCPLSTCVPHLCPQGFKPHLYKAGVGEEHVSSSLFFVKHQELIFSVSWSVSKLQGRRFGGPSFAFRFRSTSGQFWEQLSCAWKMSSALGNYTFLLTPGVLSWATSMTDRWEEVQLGHHKWFLGTQCAGPQGEKLS